MHHRIHLAFGIIWLVGVFAFAWLAFDAWHMTHIQLARYTFRIPAKYNVSIGGVNFQDVINQIAETQEQNTKMLEASIHTSYHTALWCNGLRALRHFAAWLRSSSIGGTRKISVRTIGRPMTTPQTKDRCPAPHIPHRASNSMKTPQHPLKTQPPNTSPEPTGIVAFFLFALDFISSDATHCRWLSFLR